MIKERLAQLRKIMQQHKAAFFMVPSSDAHRSEYVPEIWQRRPWISGFTGSAGDVVVGMDQAKLWTDGRYTLQAEAELELDDYTLEQYVQGAAPAIDVWMSQLPKGTIFAVDPQTITVHQGRKFNAILKSRGGKLLCVNENFIDQIRKVETSVVKPVFLQDEALAGQTARKKLDNIRQAMKQKAADVLLLNVLDDIAWTLNIRGADSMCNPLVISYLVIKEEGGEFFVDLNKIDDAVRSHLESLNIKIKPYESFGDTLSNLKGNVWLDPGSASYWMEQSLTEADEVISEYAPIAMMKAVKNKAEQAGAKEAHRKDALSLVRFFYWLENNWKGQTELSASDKLFEFRSENPEFKGMSFETIAGYGKHGAVIHYRVTAESSLELKDDNLFLCDSGGQYPEGTTDVTRTMHFGKPTAQHKEMYTRVLKGHLNLASAIFCAGTRGEHLDAIARMPIWQGFANYAHGTGHGVGAYLCVHEGPQRISTGASTAALQPGMIVSNEPGVYLEGKFGIRVENLVLIVEKASMADSPTHHGPFYGFEALTLVPHERKLMDLDLMTQEEINQVNNYHARVYATLKNDLPEDVREWLKAKTAPL